MHHLKIIKEIYKLQDDYKLLSQELKNQKILNQENFSYLKNDKEEFVLIWEKYIIFFKKIKKLLKKTKYRKYLFFINYNKFVLRKFLIHFYYKVISDLVKTFWKHELFIRNFLDERFKRNDFWIYAKYIYKPKYILVFNSPVVFILAFKKSLDKETLKILNLIENIVIEERVVLDYNNVYHFFTYRLFKIIFVIFKVIWNLISKIRFTKRKEWYISWKNLEKYLKVSKPWDILLTRWNRNATNITIPWFWKHMSMYLWTWKYIKNNFSSYKLNYLLDKEHYIIEATWKWIFIVNIKELASHNDYLSAFRTKFKQEKVNRAIKNSLNNIWKSYDFILNYYSDSRFVCSTLVMKAYSKEHIKDEWIKIKLVKIWFWITYPPNNFVKEYFKKTFKNKSEVEWIIFIDSSEKKWKSFISTIEELKKSYKRSRFTFFLK